MRKFQKIQAENIVQIIEEAHVELKKILENNEIDTARSLLAQCQECGYSLYDYVADLEGEDHIACGAVANYCSIVFDIHTEMSTIEKINVNNILKRLNKAIVEIHNSVKNHIMTKLEIVFLPYKSSMWDSMESVWLAANADENCEAFVVPIPYYDRNADWSFANQYYEGMQYPKNVPVVGYNQYNIEERKPDIIYIHNPYDGDNYVTSVAPEYYSEELKKHCELLVYIPYFSTSGEMGESNSFNTAYLNVDYIITQSEEIKKDYHKAVPKEKLVALGSPKFDMVINKCKNTTDIPAEWHSKIGDKKVIFFNTSIAGMLLDTPQFLFKMEYVFKLFMNRDDVCLLWRPHPLLESTFTSMRPGFAEVYATLKTYFINNNLGIYDDTPNMEKSIGISDMYIGDPGSSVISLFGMLGKPIFILDNNITSLPTENDWLGTVINNMTYYGDNEYKIVYGRYLYISEKNKYNYGFFDIIDEDIKNNYLRGITFKEKLFITPLNSRKIIVYENKKKIKIIELKEFESNKNTFANSILVGEHIFLIPLDYGSIVRINVNNYKVDYLEGYNELFISKDDTRTRIGFASAWKNFFIITSPVEDKVMFVDASSLKVQILKIGTENSKGYAGMIPKDDEIWCLPYCEGSIIKWNPMNGQFTEFNQWPSGFEYTDIYKDRPFTNVVFYENYALLAPALSNMFVRLDINTGVMEEWKAPFDTNEEIQSVYYKTGLNVVFLDEVNDNVYEVFDAKKRRMFNINVKTNEFKVSQINFNRDEIEKHIIGFGRISDGLIYGCCENVFNSLENFLNDNIIGESFSKESQLEAYKKIAKNADGTCGINIHKFATKKVLN